MNPTVTSNPPAPDLPDLRHSLLERSPVPTAELEGTGHVLRYVNPAFCCLVGKSTEALVGTPFADTVQKGDGCLALLDRVYHTGEAETHTEAAHPEPHSAYWSYAMWPVLDAEQHPVGVMMQVTETTLFHQQTVAMNEALLLSSVRQHELMEAAEKLNDHLQAEITERKRLEAALQQERDLLAVTLASIGDAVIATDATAVITFMNPMAEALTGWPALAAQGRPLAEVFRIVNEQTRQPAANPVEKVLREGRTVGLANHTALLTRDGREVPIADSGSPIRGKSGQLHGTVLVFRDVTEEKHAEAALVRAKEAAEAADQLKGEFLATMSHELRTPLNVILGYTEMLLDDGVGALSAAQQAMLTKIQRNSQVLFELISMVLDLNRLQAGRMPVDVREVPVAELLAEVQAEMQGLCEQSGLACEWQVAPELPPLSTDRGKLKVVIKNLVSNAVKFTQEGGITVAAEEQQGGVEIRVVDTGIGIAPEAQAFIFEPFRQVDGSDTRSYSGSGLGLHIVKRLLGVLGGTVTVESEVGRGSTFRVWLPCTKRES